MIINSEYILKTDNAAYPVTIEEVNAHLKESFVSFVTEDLLPILLKACEKFGEQFTRRVFLTKTYTNYRKLWDWRYELRRCKLGAIASLSYIDINEATQVVANTNYSTTFSDEYASLYLHEDYTFPNLSSQNPQPVIIEFSAGYGLTEADIPSNIKTAILNHLAKMWKHRGDCPEEGKNFNDWMLAHLPVTSRIIYSMERIPDLLL